MHITKEVLWYDPNSVTFWKRQNYRNDEKIRDFQGLGVGGVSSWAQSLFSAVKLPCVILSWWVLGIDYLSKATEYTPPRRRLSEHMACGWWCTNVGTPAVTSVPLWSRMLALWEAVFVGKVLGGKSPHLQLDSPGDLKLLCKQMIQF